MERKNLITCTALSILLSAPLWVGASQPSESMRSSEPGAQPPTSQEERIGGVPSAAQEDELMNMQVSQINGKKVVNAQGEELGQVDNIVRNKMSNDLEAVVAAGGFLGIGARQITVPIDQFSMQGDQLVLSNAITEDDLRQRPEYQEDQYAEVDDNLTLTEASTMMTEGATTQLSFQDIDQNQDGVISQEEAQIHQQLTSKWDDVDRNSDNQIDEAEFSAFEQGLEEGGDVPKEDTPTTPAPKQTEPGAEPGDTLLK